MSRKSGRNASKKLARHPIETAAKPDYIGRSVSLALGAVACTSSTFAADEAPKPASDSDNNLQEVVVTGIRASLQKSLDIKEQSVGVVDAISAEDIGQFPDSNLAEAIQRIPGVSISRGAGSTGGTPTSTGEGTEITVRGFGPTFNETLYDGRQAATGTKDRGFDFSSVGADFVQEVDVLKTPDSTLSSGAIGATVNIKYPKPFDSPGLKLAATASAGYAKDDGRITPNAGALFSDTFADDTFGFLVDAAFSKRDTTAHHVNSQGWEGFNLAPSQLAGAAPGASTTGSLPSWFIQDYGIYHEQTTEERKDGRLVFQWHPNDALLITLDDNFSEDVLKAQEYAYSVWFNSGSLTDVVRAPDGTLTSFVQPNTPTDFQGQIIGSVLQNNMFGANVAWDVTNTFKAEIDADQSKSRLNPGGQLTSIDSDVGYGPSGPNGTCNGPQVTCNGASVGIAGVGVGNLPYPTSVGPNGNSALFIKNGLIGSHVFPIQSQQNTDRINQAKLTGTWSGEQTKLRFGFQYTDDKKDLTEYDTFTNNDWQAYAGYGPASNNTSGIALPQSFFNGSFSTSNFIRGFNNSNLLPPQILAFNPYTMLGYLNGLNGAGAAANCCAPPFTGQYQLALNPSMVQSIEEKTYAPFVSLSQTTQLGSMELKTMLGVRYESTYLTTKGLGQLPTALTVQAADHTAFLVSYTPTTVFTSENNYRYVLPNLDLNLGVTDHLKVRLDASRTLTRPPLNDITPVLTVNQGIRTNALVATAGNPGLLPFLSDNLDLGVEWYYGRNDYISVDAFLKEVTNFIVGSTSTAPINGVTDPTKGNAIAQFNITSQINGPNAEVRGIEIGVQHMLWDTGFGLQANATFVGTNRPYNPNDITVSGFAITGLANSANFVAFFEKWGLHARVAVNWRDAYIDHFGQLQNNSAFGTEPTFVNANTQVDLSTSYDIDNHFSVFFEGLNLNSSTFSTHGRFKEQVLDVVDYGPRFTLGARLKF